MVTCLLYKYFENVCAIKYLARFSIIYLVSVVLPAILIYLTIVKKILRVKTHVTLICLTQDWIERLGRFDCHVNG